MWAEVAVQVLVDCCCFSEPFSANLLQIRFKKVTIAKTACQLLLIADMKRKCHRSLKCRKRSADLKNYLKNWNILRSFFLFLLMCRVEMFDLFVSKCRSAADEKRNVLCRCVALVGAILQRCLFWPVYRFASIVVLVDSSIIGTERKWWSLLFFLIVHLKSIGSWLSN